jgi:hypothetical protein
MTRQTLRNHDAIQHSLTAERERDRLNPANIVSEWRENFTAYLARDAARDARIDDALAELAESTRIARSHPNYGVKS